MVKLHKPTSHERLNILLYFIYDLTTQLIHVKDNRNLHIINQMPEMKTIPVHHQKSKFMCTKDMMYYVIKKQIFGLFQHLFIKDRVLKLLVKIFTPMLN